jgi:hypothetical protein
VITRDSRTAVWRRIARQRGEHSTIAADHIEVDGAAGVRVCVRLENVWVTDQQLEETVVQARFLLGSGPDVEVDLGDARIRSDGQSVTARFAGVVEDGGLLERTIDEVAAAAAAGAAQIDALRAIPGARYVAPTGPWDQRLPPEVLIPAVGAEVVLRARWAHDRAVVVASVACGGAVQAGGEHHAAAAELGASLTVAEGVARLEWALAAGPLTWVAGAQLLAALARGPGHPYR